jgi:hypothetical protein
MKLHFNSREDLLVTKTYSYIVDIFEVLKQKLFLYDIEAMIERTRLNYAIRTFRNMVFIRLLSTRYLVHGTMIYSLYSVIIRTSINVLNLI